MKRTYTMTMEWTCEPDRAMDLAKYLSEAMMKELNAIGDTNSKGDKAIFTMTTEIDDPEEHI